MHDVGDSFHGIVECMWSCNVLDDSERNILSIRNDAGSVADLLSLVFSSNCANGSIARSKGENKCAEAEMAGCTSDEYELRRHDVG